MNSSNSLRCVVVGDETLALACAELWLDRGHVIDAILSVAPDVVAWARGRTIPVVESQAELSERFGAGSVDYLFSIANLNILRDEALAIPRRFGLNFHDGPLPEYAGLNTPVWALLNGERVYGITWHLLASDIDAGDIVEREPVEIADEETSLTLNTKCYEAGVKSFGRLIVSLEGDVKRTAQPNDTARRYFSAADRPPNACLIDWQQTAREVGRLTRALDFGTYPNPVGLPKLLLPSGEVVVVRRLEDARSDEEVARPGQVLRMTDDGVEIATGQGVLRAVELSHVNGDPVSPEYLADHGVAIGVVLGGPTATQSEQLERVNRKVAPVERHWVQRLATLNDYDVPWATPPQSAEPAFVALGTEGPSLTSAFGALQDLGTPQAVAAGLLSGFLARVADQQQFDIACQRPSLGMLVTGVENVFAAAVPFRVEVDPGEPIAALVACVERELARVETRGTFARDVVARYPILHDTLRSDDLSVGVMWGGSPRPGLGRVLTLRVDGGTVWWEFDERVIASEEVRCLIDRFDIFLSDVVERPNAPLGDLNILTNDDRRLLSEVNDTAVAFAEDATIHRVVEMQVARTPEAPAVSCRGVCLTYHELNHQAEALAVRLRALGVNPRDRVGICLPRSNDMLVSVLAVLKAGAAYVPMDPSYPAHRIAMMVADADPTIVITHSEIAPRLLGPDVAVLALDKPWTSPEPAGAVAVPMPTNADDLAYVIFTSGSTGRPKGVMVEHRNVINFFLGMDAVIPHDPPGTWLAVTSLSFDISVLELLWTLARGFHVILAPERIPVASTATSASHSHQAIDFSLFYFSADESANGGDKYRLLLEGARYADANGFAAVWTPERHFHAFGGLYPNPSVVSAAIAAITERIGIRAGSCVLPLHHPARVAEEWAVVDNLSNGRVGISFASGWQPNDFVLSPDNYGRAKELMFESADTVRRLWRGEAVVFPGPKGDVSVSTLPRPVQKELPVWVTTAGNPETAIQAGRSGAFLLTHLLGQRVEGVAEKIALYRKAWKEAGHAGAGHVTLMVHTFVADDAEFVRATVRAPLKDYLRTATGLLKQYASTFPAFKTLGNNAEAVDFGALSPEDLDALLEHSFQRYFDDSGLFGTPDGCAAMIDRLKGAGVDEVACLVDFGIETSVVLEHLPWLNRLRQQSQPIPSVSDDDLGTLITNHEVTHLQCTPSMAKMLLSDAGTRGPLSRISTMLVGGEALDGRVARDLAARVGRTIHNMYGPTETTIWSSVYETNGGEGTVPIGRAVANTQLYVVDGRGRALPPGAIGELWIGGAGVTRGYFGREELTADRFVCYHDGAKDHRVYRTGDLARFRGDGTLEFLGRTDQQVKVRGHRIELGDIEGVLSNHEAVTDVICVVPTGQSDAPGVVAYFVPHGEHQGRTDALRRFAADRLPDFMVPTTFVPLDAFPLTPNGKVDRVALARRTPKHDITVDATYVAPRNAIEEALVAIWAAVLGREQVGIEDDFFALGGNSLSTIQIIFRLRQDFGVELPLRVVFSSPTVAQMAEEVSRRLPDVDDDLAQLMEEVGHLSEDEARALVNDLLDDAGPEQPNG